MADKKFVPRGAPIIYDENAPLDEWLPKERKGTSFAREAAEIRKLMESYMREQAQQKD